MTNMRYASDGGNHWWLLSVATVGGKPQSLATSDGGNHLWLLSVATVGGKPQSLATSNGGNHWWLLSVATVGGKPQSYADIQNLTCLSLSHLLPQVPRIGMLNISDISGLKQ